MLTNVWQQIDRQQIHQVHQEDPDENRQGEWSDNLAFAMVHVFHAAMYKANNQLYKSLEFSRDTAGCGFRHFTEQHQEHQTQKY